MTDAERAIRLADEIEGTGIFQGLRRVGLTAAEAGTAVLALRRFAEQSAPSPADLREVASISFGDLRFANIERQSLWCPEQSPDLAFRATELGGEVGEALNVVKKLERERLGWRGSRASVDDLAQELADVVICTDLLAMSVGIDLGAAVVAKFNATSEKVGLPTKIRAALATKETSK